ncbi:uncharacterized protein LOC133198646 [Saccostrea echinata]|uniref:uncharacterized protein LOC133198646 n=1 Tax=Saccostrea echinata TaxID=191078 RepID=UPI002A81B452|nr:uncharacterized protein LOC133198646 [Saccostrea echinata]
MLKQTFFLVAAVALASAQSQLDRNDIYDPLNLRDQTSQTSFTDSLDLNNLRGLGSNLGLSRQFDQNGLSTLNSLDLGNGLMSGSGSETFDLGRMDRQGMTSSMFDTLRGDSRMSNRGSDFDLNRMGDTTNGLLRGNRFLDSSLRSTGLTDGNNGGFMLDFNRGLPTTLDNNLMDQNLLSSQRDNMDFSGSDSQSSSFLDSLRRPPYFSRGMGSYNLNRRFQNGEGRLFNDLTGFPRRSSEGDSMSNNFMDSFDSTNSFPGRGMSMGRSMSRMRDMGMMRSLGRSRGQGRRLGRMMGRRLGRRFRSYLPGFDSTNTGSSRTMSLMPRSNRMDDTFTSRTGRTSSLF